MSKNKDKNKNEEQKFGNGSNEQTSETNVEATNVETTEEQEEKSKPVVFHRGSPKRRNPMSFR